MKLLKIILLVSVLTIIPGCWLIDSGIGGAMIKIAWDTYVTWKDGEATKYYKTNIHSAYRAVKRSLKKNDFWITEDRPYQNDSYYLVAGNNNRFKIRIYYMEPNICVIKIRIDFWGDKPYAELIYKAIDEDLNIITFDEKGKPI